MEKGKVTQYMAGLVTQPGTSFILTILAASVAAAQVGHFSTLRNKIGQILKIFIGIDYLRS